MSEVVVAEELFRQLDPAILQKALIEELDSGATVFRVKPAGLSWSEFHKLGRSVMGT